MMEHVRSNLFDFAWTVRSAGVAGRMPKSCHFWLWLLDALYDVCQGWLDAEHMPHVLEDWKRTNTALAPMTRRGIDWRLLEDINAQGSHSIQVSSLRAERDVGLVLQHPLQVVRGDVAAIEKATGAHTGVGCSLRILGVGVRTLEKHLTNLTSRVIDRAKTGVLFQAHQVQGLQSRIRTTDGGVAPRGFTSSSARFPFHVSVSAIGVGGPLPSHLPFEPSVVLQIPDGPLPPIPNPADNKSTERLNKAKIRMRTKRAGEKSMQAENPIDPKEAQIKRAKNAETRARQRATKRNAP